MIPDKDFKLSYRDTARRCIPYSWRWYWYMFLGRLFDAR
jgi:hypothetical protein